METLQKDYPEFQRLRLYRKDRKRAVGAGGKFKLSLDERVFMTLFFLRHYPVYALLGFLFDLHESNSYRNVEMMKGFISKFLPLPERVREKKMSSFEELLEEVKGIELLIDTTEQQRQKPKDKQKRRDFYSGKKKSHTVKTQVVVDKVDGLILDVSAGWEGRVHDIRVFEGSRLQEKMGIGKVKGWFDSGYEGIERLALGWEIKSQRRSQKGGD